MCVNHYTWTIFHYLSNDVWRIWKSKQNTLLSKIMDNGVTHSRRIHSSIHSLDCLPARHSLGIHFIFINNHDYHHHQQRLSNFHFSYSATTHKLPAIYIQWKLKIRKRFTRLCLDLVISNMKKFTACFLTETFRKLMD